MTFKSPLDNEKNVEITVKGDSETMRDLLNKFLPDELSDEVSEYSGCEEGCTCGCNQPECGCHSENTFEGIIDNAKGAIGGAATGARIGRVLGPKGAAAGAVIGGVLGYKSAKNKVEEDTAEELDVDELQSMVDLDSDKNIGIIEADFVGKYQMYDFYEILAKVDDVQEYYIVADVLVRDGKAKVSEIDKTFGDVMKASVYYEKHTSAMKDRMMDECLNEEMYDTIEDLKMSDHWVSRPKTFGELDDKHGIPVSSLISCEGLQVYHDDDVFGHRIDLQDDIAHKTLKVHDDVFVVETNDSAFLIRTDGKDYVRYAVKLIDDTPKDDIHADLDRIRADMLNDLEMEMEENVDYDELDAENSYDEDDDIDHSVNDYDRYSKQNRTRHQAIRTNNSGDNGLYDPLNDLEETISEQWKKFEAEATSSYLNKPLRSEEEAKKDIAKKKKQYDDMMKKKKDK